MKCYKYSLIVFMIAALFGIGAHAAVDSGIAGLATTNYVTGAIGALDFEETGGSNTVIKTIKQVDGKIDATAGQVEKAELVQAVQNSLGKADSALQGVSGGTAATGKVVTAVGKSGTNVSVTMDYVKIPVGSATAPTGVAEIWVQ